MNREFWFSDDDDDVLAQYLTEHAFDAGLHADGTTFHVGFGDADRLPRIDESDCAGCRTLIRFVPDAGWRHTEGMRARRGCVEARPGPR